MCETTRINLPAVYQVYFAMTACPHLLQCRWQAFLLLLSSNLGMPGLHLDSSDVALHSIPLNALVPSKENELRRNLLLTTITCV